MGYNDFLWHLLNFMAPAAAVAAGAVVCGLFLKRNQAQASALLSKFAINFIVGVAVLLAGLWAWGRDGKMATYALLALGVASAQWAQMRAWRD